METSEKYIKKFKGKFSSGDIRKSVESFEGLKVLAIGDIILDEYVFVHPKGRAIKDPILSVSYDNHETYAGGILVIANHISDFVDSVKLITLVGDDNPQLAFVKNSLKNNIDIHTFEKIGAPTTVKRRFVDLARKTKIFKIEYMNDSPIARSLSKEIVAYLEKELPKYDLVIVGDYGHGFINEQIRRKIEEKSKFLALNVQSNSANMGYNYFNLWKRFDFISMDEDELRLPLSKRFEDIESVVHEAHSVQGLDNFLVTLGSKGCVYSRDGQSFSAPILTRSVKDTVGAGDALFAMSALFACKNVHREIIPFVANCGGGIGVNIMGNKESISKEGLINFVDDLLE
tara:strand:+ start:786 stop:1817 length:1032 start_codon:yes stop_codon:yes gene_type:complete